MAANIAKSGKGTDNAKDASFQIVRLTDQVNALKRQLVEQQTLNEEASSENTKNHAVSGLQCGALACEALARANDATRESYRFFSFRDLTVGALFVCRLRRRRRCAQLIAELQQKINAFTAEVASLLSSQQQLIQQKADKDLQVKSLESEKDALLNSVRDIYAKH